MNIGAETNEELLVVDTSQLRATRRKHSLLAMAVSCGTTQLTNPFFSYPNKWLVFFLPTIHG